MTEAFIAHAGVAPLPVSRAAGIVTSPTKSTTPIANDFIPPLRDVPNRESGAILTDSAPCLVASLELGDDRAGIGRQAQLAACARFHLTRWSSEALAGIRCAACHRAFVLVAAFRATFFMSTP